MDLITLALFVPACFALNMVPGPNNLLSMSNAQRYGFKYAIAAGCGRLVAFIAMIFLAATGLAAVLYASETLFLVIKVAGAFYLIWVAYQLWTTNITELKAIQYQKPEIYVLAKQEFLLAAGNPKAILIFTAFLPQFVNLKQDTDIQFFILGATFLSLELLAVALYASFGVYLRGWFSKPKMRKLFNRCCATFLGIISFNLLTESKSQ